MTVDEAFFKEPQTLLNNFVNKKSITSGQNKFIPLNLGGSGTPNLYTMYLATKLSLAQRIVQCEKNGGLNSPFFFDKVRKVLDDYNMPSFEVIMLAHPDTLLMLEAIFLHHHMDFLASFF